MAFFAGAIEGVATLNTKNWDKGISGIVKGAGVAGAAIAGALVAALGKAVMTADEFQKSMSNVSTVVDDTQVSTQGLTKSLLALDPALGSTTDLTNGLYQAFSAGAKDAEEAMQITTDSAMFAKAALTDTATAVDVLTTASNAYGSEVVNSTQAADIFFTTIKEGKITGEQLSGTIGQSIPLFASMNIPLEELASGLAAMTKQGVSANEATTQLNGIVNAFLKPSTAMTEALEAQGFASGAALLEAEGLSGALEFLEKTTGGNTDEMAALIPNIRGMQGALALTGKGGEIFADTLVEMESAAGATAEAFDKQEKTFETFANSMEKTEIVVGNIAKTFVDEWAAGATEANESMLEFLQSSEGMGIVADIVGFVAGAFEAVKAVMQPIADAIAPALESNIQQLGETFGTAEESASGLSIAAQVLGVAAQVVAGAIRITSIILNTFIQLVGDLVNALGASGEVIGGWWDALLSGEWDEFNDRLGTAQSAFTTLGSNLDRNFSAIIGGVQEEFANFGENAETTAIKVQSAFVESSQDAKDFVTRNWSELFTGQEKTAADMVDNAEQTGQDVADAMENMGEDAADAAGEAGENVGNAFIEGLEKNLEKIEPAYSAAMDSISTIGSMISSIEQTRLENETRFLDLQYQKQQEALQNRLNNGLISEAEFNAQSEQLEQETNRKRDEIAKRQFEAEKRNKVAQVVINAADSIMRWWSAAASLGPIAGPAFAGVMTGATAALSAAQISAISAQPYVPAFQMGGTHSGGLARINEAGGEIVNLPDGTVIVPNDISQMIAANSGNSGIVVNVNNPTLLNRDMISMVSMQVSQEVAKNMRLSRI